MNEEQLLRKETETFAFLPFLFSWLHLAWQKRVQVAIIWVSVTVLAIVLSLVLPSKYTPTATVLPTNSRSGSGLFSQLSSIAGIQMQSGGGITSELYPTILMSRELITRVLESDYKNGKYMDVLLAGRPINSAEWEGLIESVRLGMLINTNKETGVIAISLTLGDADFAASMLNTMLKHLETYLTNNIKSQAQNQLEMISNRIEEVSGKLHDAEEALIEFRTRNRSLSDSPELVATEGRLRREVEILNGVYIELVKQQELYKIEAIGGKPVLNVLDSAYEPVYRSFPRRKVFAIFGFAAGLFLALLSVKLPELIQVIQSAYHRGVRTEA